MDQLPRLGKRELICLLLFTCNYVVFVWRGFLFLWVLGMGFVILLWHSLSLPYNYFVRKSLKQAQRGFQYKEHCIQVQYFRVCRLNYLMVKIFNSYGPIAIKKGCPDDHVCNFIYSI